MTRHKRESRLKEGGDGGLVSQWICLKRERAARLSWRALTNQQLVDKDPDGPPVAFPAVDTIAALRLEHLGGDVVWRAHGCVTVHHARLSMERQDKWMLGGWRFSPFETLRLSFHPVHAK